MFFLTAAKENSNVINKKKVSIVIILIVIIIGIIIGLVVYNSGKREDILIQREEQNTNIQNTLTDNVENNNENTEQNIESQGDEETLENARIKLTINGDKEVFVNLDDNQASRDFLEMLPLTLTFEDFNSTEKIATLPGELSTEGLPSGYTPAIGDFSYYAPWGNVSVFYKDFRYSNSLYKLGTIESGTEILGNINSDFEVTIERVD